AANKAVDVNEFLVGNTEISLANRHEHVAVLALGPDPERLVGVTADFAVHARGRRQENIFGPHWLEIWCKWRNDRWSAVRLPISTICRH
ncbi:MAG TPA: hypothetical protein VFO15_15045, partial [Xanthobacteraceae bacterium]|nr:hypothetical protein [Xanthobacteraceae bacterium]